ncbi:MAG: MarR family transcriptional regulator [Actinomycetota bacterium]|nr:MarR family transcriptional regulator [Actinomycetota bacterium]
MVSEPRWLDGEEQRTWRAFLTATRVLFDELDRQLQRDAGMPHAYYEILVRLSEAPDRMLRMSQLAQRSQSSRSRLSHAVARLEDAGWVRRVECPTDRRGLLAVLTDEGFAALAAAAPGHVEAVRRLLFDPLTADQVAQLRAVSEAVLAQTRDTDKPAGATPADTEKPAGATPADTDKAAAGPTGDCPASRPSRR